MRIRIGDVKATDSTYQEFLSGVPFMYSIEGLPSGQRALIALFGHSWKILRVLDGEPGTWSGDFPTPHDAVAMLASELHAQLAAVDQPQPHDGIAQQREDGSWMVYQVRLDGQVDALEGPYEKERALDRLRALVPVNVGDQWVIDRWGVASTLN